MFKIIIAVVFILTIICYDGVCSYKDVQNLSDLGSLINIYLSTMTAVILLAFGLDELILK